MLRNTRAVPKSHFHDTSPIRLRLHDPFDTLAKRGSSMSTTPQIISDPSIMMGKPVVAGTRITVELIIEKLAAGETIDQLLAAHPRLTREAVYAALAFAAEALRADVVYRTPLAS